MTSTKKIPPVSTTQHDIPIKIKHGKRTNFSTVNPNVKMSVNNAVLLTFITLFSINIRNTFGECVSDTPCSCVMSNGDRYDLTKIIGDKDEFIKSTTVSNRTFYFHPCSDKVFSIDDPKINTTGCSSSSGISLCMYNATSNNATTLGITKNSRLILKSPDPLRIIFDDKSSPEKIVIDIFCDPREKLPIVFSEFDIGPDAKVHNLYLISPHACKLLASVSGLSTGSVLVIILFVFSGVYFGGGALALKLLRGATGWEMLPNHKFWFDLPALVRDGVAFTFNGCKVVSYDQI